MCWQAPLLFLKHRSTCGSNPALPSYALNTTLFPDPVLRTSRGMSCSACSAGTQPMRPPALTCLSTSLAAYRRQHAAPSLGSVAAWLAVRVWV